MCRALVLLVALVGCGDDEIRPVGLDEYGLAAMDSLCRWATRCKHVPDDATCRRMLDPTQFDVRRAVDAVSAGRLAYDPSEAGRCVVAPDTATCYDAPFGGDGCAHVFTGLVPEGSACTTDLECADHAMCEQPTCDVQCCLGTCGAPQPAPVAPSPHAIGESCETHFDCRGDAYCAAGVCTALPTHAGDPCVFGCATGDLFCDTTDLTCHAYTPLGEACDDAHPCSATYATCFGGSCVPRPGAGEPCDADARCIPTTYCQNSVCVERGTAGDACNAPGECDIACDELTSTCVAYESCGG